MSGRVRFFFRTPGRDLSYFFLSSVKWACMVESIVRTCAFAYKHSTLRAQLWQPAAVCNWLSLVEIDHMSSFQWMSIEMTWASKKNGARALGGGRPEKRWHLEEIWAWMINSNFLITDQVLFHNKQDNLTRECMLNVNYPDSRRFLSIKPMVNMFVYFCCRRIKMAGAWGAFGVLWPLQYQARNKTLILSKKKYWGKKLFFLPPGWVFFSSPAPPETRFFFRMASQSRFHCASVNTPCLD